MTQNKDNTQDVRRAFGAMVGCVNRLLPQNATPISVKAAMTDSAMLRLFNTIRGYVQSPAVDFVCHSTSKQALDGTDVCKVDREVLKAIYNTPNLVQAQYALLLCRRIGTLNGAVDRLRKRGYVQYTGRAKDPESKHYAKTVDLTPLARNNMSKAIASITEE